ncbi:MAG: response regulator [Melioribacteraceae bacterium]|jgi:signal transduction histidine kinase/CheY-like chemotaxis protein/methyl-accepting chemotaxis protein|nr:response regulator [Melioribacteraceae bacterium]
MKINVRLLLITFSVIVIISLSSTFVYYSTTTSLLKNQHSKTLLNSTTDFNLAFQNLVASLDNELYEITEEKNFSPLRLDALDFIITIDENSEIVSNRFAYSSNINRALFANSFDDFLIKYPNIILKYYQNNEKEAFFYGKVINEQMLNTLSEKVRAEVVLIIDKTPYISSNKLQNEVYYPSLIEVVNKKVFPQNPTIFYKEIDNVDFFANSYTPEFLIFSKDPLQFIVFTVPTDLAEFRGKMQSITLTIASTGVLLSLIFVLLFTTKIRKQISLLSEATRITVGGDLSHRVKILSNDELGNLGKVFNDMLEHIQLNEKSEREYSELITIINKTPILKELTDTVLEKIITTTSVLFGVFYLVEKQNVKPISKYGISQSVLYQNDTEKTYSDVLDNKKTVELTFDDNSPVIKTGLAEIKIKYLLIMPIIFNNTILGIIELACEHVPSKSPIHYLNKIKYQLAVGLNSALSFEQLENLVNELRLLNEEYHKQNLQISNQNSELLNLHQEFKTQAEELEKQRGKAVELSHVKSQFLANMSHELRTPLNSILGLTELISEDSSTFPKTKDRLKIVLRNGKKLLSMINNILEFSKIESGKFDVIKSNFVLSEFTLDIYNAMEPLVTEKGLNFEITLDSNFDLLINSDRHKLEQILLNLLSNAIKFTDVGGIKILLTIIDNISLRIDVIDTGIGISDEEKKRIFNEFEQVDYTSSRKYQGAGLGLAICKKYVELLGGEILVSGNNSSGTTFSVKLSNVILEKFTINKNLQHKNSIANSEQETKRIVILQNEEESNQEILNYFGKNDFDVIESNAGADVINQLEQTSIDGIVLNLSVNSASEWELIYQLKENKKSKDIALFVLFQNKANNVFYSQLFADFIADFNDFEYLQKLIELFDIQYNEVKSVQIISNYHNEIEESISKLDRTFSIAKTKLGPNFSKGINSEFDLSIIDASLFDTTIWNKLKSKNTPILIFINQKMINENLAFMKNNWLSLSAKYSISNEEVFALLSQQISLTKKIKKSVTSQIEKVVETSSATTMTTSRFNVLVVDDDKDTQFTVGEILQNIGCDVSYSNNGLECLSTLKDYTPDLILLDIMMPVMDGFETVKKIRTNEKTKHLTVYAITAQAMLDDISIIKNSGFDDLITKPVNASTLSFKIQQAIQKRTQNI